MTLHLRPSKLPEVDAYSEGWSAAAPVVGQKILIVEDDIAGASAACFDAIPHLNREKHCLLRGQRRMALMPREFSILEHMMNHTAALRMTLMQEVWNIPFDPTKASR
jgi:hypothetical protein